MSENPHGSAETAEERERKRKRGTLGGLAVIALGVISAIIMYLVQSRSLNYFNWLYASDFAIIHAVLWGIVGLVIILYHNRTPHDPTLNQ